MGFSGKEVRELGRIVALLVALAVLAERAGGRAFPLRFLVLSLLLPAEAVARRFVAEVTGIDPASFDDAARFSPLDAAVLAMRLRVLAAVLGALVDAAGRLDRLNRGGRAARGPSPRVRLRPAGCLAAPLFDTS